MMNVYKYVSKNFQKGFRDRSDSFKKRIQEWRKQSAITRIESPTNIARARSVGFKAKQDCIIVRVRVSKGKLRRRATAGGRKPGRNRKTQSSGLGLKGMAESKAGLRFSNFNPVNSYLVGEDGQFKFFEVILKKM